MSVLSYFFLLGALWYGWKYLNVYSDAQERKQRREDEIARWKNSIERTPDNASAYAALAEMYVDDGKLADGIHHYRTAISMSPTGPFATKWKRKLKQALEWEEIVERCRREGKPLPKYSDWRVCDQCEGTVSVHDKTCPRCGATLQMSLLEWGFKKETQVEIWRSALPIAAVLWICFVIFSVLPLEWKGTVLISSALVFGYLILQSMNGDRSL